MRSSQAQALLYDAIKAKIVRQQISEKKAPAPVPRVQKPGVSTPITSDDEVQAALAKFKASPSPLTASFYLDARRAAKRDRS